MSGDDEWRPATPEEIAEWIETGRTNGVPIARLHAGVGLVVPA